MVLLLQFYVFLIKEGFAIIWIFKRHADVANSADIIRFAKLATSACPGKIFSPKHNLTILQILTMNHEQ